MSRDNGISEEPETLDSQESAPLSPLDARFNDIIKAMEEWVADHCFDEVKEVVHTALNDGAKKAVLQAFGLRKGWDNDWELDSQNKVSPAHDLIQQAISSNGFAVINSFNPRELTPAARKKIEKSMQRAYEECVADLSVEAAKKQATADANAIVEAFVASKKLPQYLAMRKLLNT